MGYDGVVSGYPTPTGFHRLTGCQRNPWDRGVTRRAKNTLVIFCEFHFNIHNKN